VRRVAASLSLAGTLLLTAAGNAAEWATVQYRADDEATVVCTAQLLCEITFNSDERIDKAYHSDRADWQTYLSYSGTPPVPHIIFRPSRAGLSANVVVPTTKRDYHLRLVSVAGDEPRYVQYHYEDERRVAARSRPVVRATPAPTVAQLTDAACAAMSGDFYRIDAQPAQWRPVRACHDFSHTFLQLAASRTAPTDVPIPFALTAGGDAMVNYVYDPSSRTYRIDGVPDGVVLTLGTGKKGMRMRALRVAAAPSSAASSLVPTPHPTVTSSLDALLGAHHER
jgi:type IV secretory pathway VirB9-like protein